MSAYATRQPEQSTRHLPHLEHVRSRGDRSRGRSHWIEEHAVTSSGLLAGLDALSAVDALVDHLADRLVAAVVERLGGDQDQADEWLDSRQAADYLGLHRDTLRRFAAARVIPAEQDGRGCKLFFRRAVLDDWRQSGGRCRHLAAVADAA